MGPETLIALALTASFAAALIVALARAPATPRAAPPAPPLGGAELAAAAGVEDALAALVRRPTVSSYDPGAEDGAAFEALMADLPRLFPAAHAAMAREELGDRALLYRWEGKDPSLEPVILCAHFDVVPADDEREWSRPPFSGLIEEGEVWGRGTQDIKCTLASMLHAAERLALSGFSPRRTIYMAFGGDEEAGGTRGAKRIGEALEERGVRASFLLDEGGPIADGMLSFADRPLALIGISEKGYIDVLVEAEGSGGHASMPPAKTAVGRVARTVAAIEAYPPKSRLCFTTRAFLSALASFSPFGLRLLCRNLWLFGPVIRAVFGSGRMTNALVRTTYAPTMLSGSPKENVLADRASANVNVRILPGDSAAGVIRRAEGIARAEGAKARPAHPEAVVEPLPESPVDHEGFRAIEAALASSFPEAAALPFLFCAGTDTKHYRRVAGAIYRLTPLRQSTADLDGIHGRNERVAVDNLRRCELFYEALISSI